jgi:nickel-dependent lactate racemase
LSDISDTDSVGGGEKDSSWRSADEEVNQEENDVLEKGSIFKIKELEFE